MQSLKKLYVNQVGGVAIIFALGLPMMLIAVGGTLDYLSLSRYKARLQGAVDAAALASAKEMKLSDADSSRLQEVASAVLKANMRDTGKEVSVSTSVNSKDHTVTVNAVMSDIGSLFGQFLSPTDSLKANATAHSMGFQPLCALAMGDDPKGTLALNAKSRLTGNQCAVYSNSMQANGVMARDGSSLKTGLTCSAGGFEGDENHYDPLPLTDCPKLADPLANRPAPNYGSCTENNLQVGSNGSNQKEKLSGSIKNGMEVVTEEGAGDIDRSAMQQVTLSPGVYCGGLIIEGEVVVNLEPGIYIIKDGPLTVTDRAALIGENVGFYFTGKKAVFLFAQDTYINLTAPKFGGMASILFFQDRSSKSGMRFGIMSDDARVLLGTIYLPKGELYVDSFRPVADLSAYTVVIADRLSLFSGPHLMLNTNYGATDIPVPDGIIGNPKTRLIQ